MNDGKARLRILPRVGSWSLVALALGGAAFLYLHNPFEQPLTVCVFRLLTGLLCPGCGMTRAAYLILHGHIPEGLAMNPFVLMLPVVAALIFCELSPYLIGRKVKAPSIPMPALIVVGVAWLAYTVLRNIV